MKFGSNNNAAPDVAYCFSVRGQSNADSLADSNRIVGDFCYKGILTGYPSAITTQERYVREPSGCFIYNKQGTDDNLWGVDNGVIEPYRAIALGNARNKAVRNADNRFGCEAGILQLIQEYTGKEAYCFKPAFGATALDRTDTGASLPGPWNNNARQIATDFYMQRFVRDFRIHRPGVRLIYLGGIWWHGERPATKGQSAAGYQSDYTEMHGHYLRNVTSNFVIDPTKHPLWGLVKVKFNKTAAETTINTGLVNTAAAVANHFYIDVDQGGRDFPRNIDLTPAEASPVAVSGSDDNHNSHITMYAVAEAYVNHLIANDRLQPA